MPKTKRAPFKNTEVANVFKSYPVKLQNRLLLIRDLIYEVAANTEGVGELEETLKWGSPSYLTTQSKSGTTLRIDRLHKQEGKYSIFVHCQTTLVGPFRKKYGDAFDYDGNRGLLLDMRDALPVKELRHFIFMALTYHLSKKQKNNRTPRS
jgi:hypothetical protein